MQVIQDGMSTKLWQSVLREVLKEHQRLAGSTLQQLYVFEGTVAEEDGWDQVQAHCLNGSPVLIHLKGAYNHFTVVTRVTPGRIILFDSGGQRYLHRKRCSVGKSNAFARFRVNRKSVVALGVK